MGELIAIILAVGSLLPLLTSVIQQPRWSDKTRTAMAVGVSVLAGLVTYVTQFGLNVDSPSAIVIVVVGVVLAASTAYKTIWKPAGVAPAIEAKTSARAIVVEAPSTSATAVDEGQSFNRTTNLH